ncbi:hypothetical protein HDK64DRAFT_123097 [Phyllosticta capitalensis]
MVGFRGWLSVLFGFSSRNQASIAICSVQRCLSGWTSGPFAFWLSAYGSLTRFPIFFPDFQRHSTHSPHLLPCQIIHFPAILFFPPHISLFTSAPAPPHLLSHPSTMLLFSQDLPISPHLASSFQLDVEPSNAATHRPRSKLLQACFPSTVRHEKSQNTLMSTETDTEGRNGRQTVEQRTEATEITERATSEEGTPSAVEKRDRPRMSRRAGPVTRLRRHCDDAMDGGVDRTREGGGKGADRQEAGWETGFRGALEKERSPLWTDVGSNSR